MVPLDFFSAASSPANNNKCGSGVAPNSKVSGIRLIAEGTTDLDEAEGLFFGVKEGDNHVLSCSWGPEDDGQRLEGPLPHTEDALGKGTVLGRGGKGAVYVWAAGNGRENKDNCNYDGYANNRFTIPVGAVAPNGQVAW